MYYRECLDLEMGPSMSFWNALWNNDHAISYLAEKHTRAAGAKALNSIPRPLKVLGIFLIGLFALGTLVTSIAVAVDEGLPAGLMLLLIAGFYILFFWGIYRAWTVGALLSKLRQCGAITTFLNTSISAEETVDVLAARCARQFFLFCALPMSLGFLVLTVCAAISRPGPECLVFLVVVPVLGFFTLLGSYGMLVVHAGSSQSGPRAIGTGFVMALGCLYVPFIFGGLLLVVVPAFETVFGWSIGIYFLCLPLVYRRLAIRGLKKEPSSGGGAKVGFKGLCKNWIRVVVAMLPSWSTGSFARLADRNPVFARSFGRQNLLFPLVVGSGLTWLTSRIVTSFPAEIAQGPGEWFPIHIATWMIAAAFSMIALGAANLQATAEKQSGTFEVLQSTPLAASKVIDGWALGVCSVYVVLVVPVLFYVLPGAYSSVAFALCLPICAAYGGIATGLKDTVGSWVCGVICALVFVSWVLVPVAFDKGVPSPYAIFAALVLGAAWFLRRRALIAYGV